MNSAKGRGGSMGIRLLKKYRIFEEVEVRGHFRKKHSKQGNDFSKIMG